MRCRLANPSGSIWVKLSTLGSCSRHVCEGGGIEEARREAGASFAFIPQYLWYMAWWVCITQAKVSFKTTMCQMRVWKTNDLSASTTCMPISPLPHTPFLRPRPPSTVCGFALRQGGEILDKAQRQEAELRQAQHELEHRRDQETSLVSGAVVAARVRVDAKHVAAAAARRTRASAYFPSSVPLLVTCSFISRSPVYWKRRGSANEIRMVEYRTYVHSSPPPPSPPPHPPLSSPRHHCAPVVQLVIPASQLTEFRILKSRHKDTLFMYCSFPSSRKARARESARVNRMRLKIVEFWER